MTLPYDYPARCLGTTDAECASCARRIERAEATPWTWWMVPPVVRPCEARVEIETQEAIE